MARTEDMRPGSLSGEQQSWLRPQLVVFALLAEHVLERGEPPRSAGDRLSSEGSRQAGASLPPAVFSGSFIEVLRRLGITEHATRSTLLRMARRGLLTGKRSGRNMYFAMTPRCISILEDGRRRIWEIGAVNDAQVDRWTLLTFSMPESWRRKRYDLRSRLTWAGFGPLQNGAWLAPAEVDVTPIVAELGLDAHVRAFHIQPIAPTDAAAVIRETFDLDTLAERYRSFTLAWSGADPDADALVVTLRLSTSWLRIIREDPRVPLHLLPADWPAIEAQQLFRSLHGARRAASIALASELLETLPL